MVDNKLKVNTIFFDLDDTVLNTQKAQYNAICEFKKLHSIFDETSNEEFAKLWNNITGDTYDKYLRKEITFKELTNERIQKLFSLYKINLTPSEAEEKYNEYIKIYENNWLPFDDTFTVLDSLKKKYKLYAITNGDSKQQRLKAKKTHLENYFQDIFVSSEIGFAKPKKEIFEFSCKKVHVNPNECVMIGDKFKTDIEGSLNAGMHAIWANRKNEDINYPFQIKELSELEKFL